MIDITKMTCCDFCFDEWKRNEIKWPYPSEWEWHLNHKTIRFCNKHAREMVKQLTKIVEEENKNDEDILCSS